MTRRFLALALSLTAAAALPASIVAAENWAQWRGPHGDGSSQTAEPPLRWSEEENIRWKVEIPGRGSSTPIIWGDRIYLLSALRTDRRGSPSVGEDTQQRPTEPTAGRGRSRGGFGPAQGQTPPRGGQRRGGRGGGSDATNYYHQYLVMAYDRHSGEQLWQKVATEQVPHEAGHGTNTFASSSPLTDGEHLYVNFGSRGIYCFDMEGNQKWQRDLGQMRTRNDFGEATSPALHDGKLIIQWDHEGQSSLVALDADNGETLWQVPRDERTTWATPLITQWDGRWQVVTNGTTVRSYDLEDGALLWEAASQGVNPIPSPLRYKDAVVTMIGYQGFTAQAIKLDAMGDVTQSDAVLWRRSDSAPYVASPTLYDGRLYFTKSRDGIVSSVDAETGETVIGQQRLPGISSIYASPVAAKDRIYITGREGATVVLRHAPSFEVLATNRLDDVLDASPVMIGPLMYIRGEKYLYCIGDEQAQ